jgi:hypothetical protein
LHRQVIHREAAVGQPKAASAAAALTGLNRRVVVHTHHTHFTSENALRLVADYDIVADCTDNPATRYLINDACMAESKLLVSASSLRMEGQLAVYAGGAAGPCYRCVFPSPPPAESLLSCSSAGVLGVVPGVMGCLQALEVIKAIVGTPSLVGRLLLFDAATMMFRTVKLRAAKSGCVACGGGGWGRMEASTVGEGSSRKRTIWLSPTRARWAMRTRRTGTGCGCSLRTSVSPARSFIPATTTATTTAAAVTKEEQQQEASSS